jgi:hypothetical protein
MDVHTLSRIERSLRDADTAASNAVKIANALQSGAAEIGADDELTVEQRQARIRNARDRSRSLLEAEEATGRRSLDQATEALRSLRSSRDADPADRERVRAWLADGLTVAQIASRAAGQGDSKTLAALGAEVPYIREGDGPRQGWADPEPKYAAIAQAVAHAKKQGANVGPGDERLAGATLAVERIAARLDAAVSLGQRTARGDRRGAALARVSLGHVHDRVGTEEP